MRLEALLKRETFQMELLYFVYVQLFASEQIALSSNYVMQKCILTDASQWSDQFWE